MKKQPTFRYMWVYNHFKQLILSGEYQPGDKIPSIRRCAQLLQVSKTTVESAYMLLETEGRILSKAQSGYYVTAAAKIRSAPPSTTTQPQPLNTVQYNFATRGADKHVFSFELWQRYLKSALRQQERLLRYGDVQGEFELREAICQYVQRARNVVCTPQQIIVGAGVQSLLHLLCPLLPGERTVEFYTPFTQGEAVFADHGYTHLPQSSAHILYVSPSHLTPYGSALSLSQRFEILQQCRQQQRIIVEDDYGSELCYDRQPISSLQGLSGGKGVVYLGTFSPLLLPSIRIGFMVLPQNLLSIYQERRQLYNQSASQLEQLALGHFIANGQLESQIRRARRSCLQKTTALANALQGTFGSRVNCLFGDGGYTLLAQFCSNSTPHRLAQLAANAGIALTPQKFSPLGQPGLLLCCSGVDTADYPSAAKLLYSAIAPAIGAK